MCVGVAGMEGGFHDSVAHHSFGITNGDLLLIEDEGVGENLRDRFQLVM